MRLRVIAQSPVPPTLLEVDTASIDNASPGTPIGRRAFLALTGVVTASIVVGGGAGRLLANLVPGAGGGGEFEFYNVAASIPVFDPAAWRLRVGGLVQSPVTLTYSDLQSIGLTTVVSDFHCVTGWSVRNCQWEGVRIRDLVAHAGPLAGAAGIEFRSMDRVYTDSLPLPTALRDDVLLAINLNGQPLAPERGAPTRLVIPGWYGYKGVKWVEELRLVRSLDPGFWEQRGYDADARIRK